MCVSDRAGAVQEAQGPHGELSGTGRQRGLMSDEAEDAGKVWGPG